MGVALLLLFLVIYLNKREKMIEAWIKAIIIWTMIAYVSLEILSLFSAVTFGALFILWGGTDLALAICLFWLIGKKKAGKGIGHICVNTIRKNKIWFVLALGLIILSIWTVPYNWDSMTYHLSRIASWTQNKSIAYYSTNNLRQISSPVLAEFINLHVYILSGRKDFFLNLLQCISSLTNMWFVYEISKKIGCRRIYCLLAAFLFYTAPSMFGESLTTQTDQFATVWLMIFVYYFLDLFDKSYRFQYNRKTLSVCLLMGISLSFGYLAKPSVLIGAAVLALALLVRCIWRKDSASAIIKLLVSVIPVMGGILGPEMARNLLGSVSTFEVGRDQLVGTLNPVYILVNWMKNFSFNWPSIYLYKSDHWIAAIIYRLAGFLGVNIDDPSISYTGRPFELHEAATYEPDMAVNEVIIIFFTLCFLWGIYRYKKQKSGLGKEYSMLVSLIFIIFCAVVIWEPWVSRYMIPCLTLLCPMIAYELEDFEKVAGKYGNYALPLILFMCCVELFGLGMYHVGIAWREGKDRFAGYFRNNRALYTEYNEVCEYLKDSAGNGLGLYLGLDSYEYPLWACLDERMGEIRHVMVQNESSKFEEGDFLPEYIATDLTREENLVFEDKEYVLVDVCRDNNILWLYQLKTE